MRKAARLPLSALAPWLHELPVRGAYPPVDWAAVFGNAQPVEVEVGFGKGLFLATAATANPGTNWFGIEIVRKYQLFAATRLAKRALPNVRVACGDGLAFLRDAVPAGSVQAVHVYFPDPWWKNRHRKRRLFTLEFAQAAGMALRSGGRLNVVTDVADYAAMVRATVAALPGLEELPPPEERPPEHDMDYLTNFERKFRQEGRAIHRMAYERA
ncbi:MAG: tRNA (guanosine(46)-N7)-methyltransferase TrmB [Gemmataceae bacterium]|nr:tRNA (guanosine(46)-N7)-methyltransferase TrmB [Gemmataceae bacterium]